MAKRRAVSLSSTAPQYIPSAFAHSAIWLLPVFIISYNCLYLS